MHRDADTVTDHVANDAEAVSFDVLLDAGRDIADAIADLCLTDAEIERLAADAKELLELRCNRADGNGEGVVADVAVVPDDDVEGNHIAIAQNPAKGRYTVDDFVVNRDAGVG